MQIIYYYQTFCGLKQILDNPNWITTINLSSIHFGNGDNKPYIHLNDNPPDDPIFDNLWMEIAQIQKSGVKIILMVGGAGGGYFYLFNNYDKCFKLLEKTIRNYNIQGIDLDIEESVNILDVIKLIVHLKQTFGNDFIITMAPVLYSLQYDVKGLGDFCYKKLYNLVGDKISWFNVQSYYSYTSTDYDLMIKNGYPANKLVLGMISSQFDKNTFTNALDTIKTLKNKYTDFGGCYVWEYFDAPPDNNNHSIWAKEIYELTNVKYVKYIISLIIICLSIVFYLYFNIFVYTIF